MNEKRTLLFDDGGERKKIVSNNGSQMKAANPLNFLETNLNFYFKLLLGSAYRRGLVLVVWELKSSFAFCRFLVLLVWEVSFPLISFLCFFMMVFISLWFQLLGEF